MQKVKFFHIDVYECRERISFASPWIGGATELGKVFSGFRAGPSTGYYKVCGVHAHSTCQRKSSQLTITQIGRKEVVHTLEEDQPEIERLKN